MSMIEGMSIVAGLALDGAALTDVHDLAPRHALIGQASFGPMALLRDLELRLGLVDNDASPAVRGARWSSRVMRLAAERFYARSHAVDAWGTALELLRWRDELVLAGWDGAPIESGGERLAALAELEAMAQPSLPPSEGDRLIAIARTLITTPSRVYARLRLVDAIELWPLRWQHVFARLAASGCAIELYAVESQLALPDSDLGRLQHHDFSQPAMLTGDGSLVLLRADTPWEAAHATAALLRAFDDEDCVVIRGWGAAPLEAALSRQGLPSQGLRVTTTARPLVQLVSLAIELAFEPKDPFRILELLLLHHGPFDGAVGRRLARALAERPGLGPSWHAAKAELADAIRERHRAEHAADGGDLARAARDAEAEIAARVGIVEPWIEAAGSPIEGATRAALQTVAARVRAWLATASTRHPDDILAALALTHATALVDALEDDPRERIDLVQARQLVQTIIGHGCTLEVAMEAAGRLDHVDEPAALLAPRDTVVWWRCVEGDVSLPRFPTWSRHEEAALARHGVAFVDAQAQLAAVANGWRRALMSARRRLILVQPRAIEAVAQDTHPFVDELAARTRDPLHGLDIVTVDAAQLLTRRSRLPLPDVQLAAITSLPLPQPRDTWRVDPGLLPPLPELSASSIETLLGCPLRFVLVHHAGVHASKATVIPTDNLLYGRLGHRLVEELHRADELTLPLDELEARARARLHLLVVEEGAPLRLAGVQSELAQLEAKLIHAVRSLSQFLQRVGMSIASVEQQREVVWHDRRLSGRTDLLLRRPDGGEAIVDLKWGRSRYRDALVKGRALQLATYAFISKQSNGTADFPPTGYFSLSRGVLLTTERDAFAGARPVTGNSAPETWLRLDATLTRVERLLQTGAIPVAGVGEQRPIVEHAGTHVDAPDALHIEAEHACAHCDHAAVCGRRWECA